VYVSADAKRTGTTKAAYPLVTASDGGRARNSVGADDVARAGHCLPKVG
jgi:hypothetical protein